MQTHFRVASMLHAALASLAIVTLGACGGDSPTAPVVQTPVPEATVQATPSEKFTPGQITLTAGGTVTFAFGSLAHNVFFDNDPAGAPDNIPDASANTSVTSHVHYGGDVQLQLPHPPRHAGNGRCPIGGSDW